MEDEEERKVKANIAPSNNSSLPDINKNKTGTQCFQMDDFNSKGSDKEENEDPKEISQSVGGSGDKIHTNKRMSHLSEKLNHMEDINSHKNRTVTGSDHKPFSQFNGTKAIEKNVDAQLDNSRSGIPVNKEKKDESDAPEAGNEILYKERKKPKCPSG